MEKIDKIDKPLARLNKTTRERKQITDIRNIYGVINRDPTDIKRIIRKQNEQLSANKFDNVDRMGGGRSQTVMQPQLLPWLTPWGALEWPIRVIPSWV